MNMKNEILIGTLLDEKKALTLGELSYACHVHAEWIIELVEEGILEPVGNNAVHWRFPCDSIKRAQAAIRLQQDLGINLEGAALALDLIDEIETLHCQLRKLQKFNMER